MSKLWLFICGMAFTISLTAQTKPNFSGTWILNLAESDYSAPGASKPDRLVRTVDQKGDHLKYRVEREKDGQKGSFHVELTIGGPPFESDEAGVVSAAWNGSALVITTVYNPGSDRQASQTESWALSADRRRVTDGFAAHRMDGKETHLRRVFDKQ